MSTRVIQGGPNGTWVGSTFIPAGEYRSFYENELPMHLRGPVVAPVAVEEPVAADPMLALIDKTVAEIEAAVPALSDAELDELAELNDVGDTRKGVAAAIAAEKEAREAQAQEVEAFLLGHADVVTAELATLTDYQLTAALDLEQNGQDREPVVAAIKALQEARRKEAVG